MNEVSLALMPAPTEDRPAPVATLAEALQRIAELEETESALSTEVLEEGKQHRHWKVMAGMLQEALDEANTQIKRMETDLKEMRIRYEQYPEGDGNEALPYLDPAREELCTKWFKSRDDALAYASNAGFFQRPEKRRVWRELAWCEEWSLRVKA